MHSGACITVRGTNEEEAMRVRVQLALGGLNMLGEVILNFLHMTVMAKLYILHALYVTTNVLENFDHHLP
jgi:hypothetical protein